MNIDSRFRDDYFTTSSANFQFELPDIQRKVTSLRIASLDIPMTHYAVSNERGDATFLIGTNMVYTTQVNDTFLQEHPAFLSGGVSGIDLVGVSVDSILSTRTAYVWLVTLPDGNYEMSWQGKSNAADLELAMQEALRSAKPVY